MQVIILTFWYNNIVDTDITETWNNLVNVDFFDATLPKGCISSAKLSTKLTLYNVEIIF